MNIENGATALEQYTNKTILTWGLAFALAKENPQGLTDGTMTTLEASRRMQQLEDAEQKMLALPDLVSPSQLKRFRQAKADRGCRNCWLSGRRNKDHADCGRKIREYFAAREALLVWIASGVHPAAPPDREGGDHA